MNIPEELQTLLSSFENKGYTTPGHYYDHALEYKFPLGACFDKQWVQESVIPACELFDCHHNRLNLNDYPEGNMLHEVWSFVYKLYKDREIVAKVGENCSVANSMAKNNKRSLEAITPRERKRIGSKLDILFTADKNELGACEVGKEDVSIIDDKYLNDGSKKLPNTLREMLVAQISINPDKANSLCTVGYLMMGKLQNLRLTRFMVQKLFAKTIDSLLGIYVELLVVDMPFGSLISRVVRSSRLAYPVKINNFAIDYIPLLELAYTGKQIMQNNINVLDDRKRRKALDDINSD